MTKFTYGGVFHYALTGISRPHMVEAVSVAIEMGLVVERISDSAYRLLGRDDLQKDIAELAGWIEALGFSEYLSIGMERPPEDALEVKFKVEPARPWLRSTYVQGRGHAAVVVSAIDHGLMVSTAGHKRFMVKGQTMTQASWLAAANGSNIDESLRTMGLTRETAAAEDSAAPPVAVDVILPPRETTSKVTRDRAGNIETVVQTEVTTK